MKKKRKKDVGNAEKTEEKREVHIGTLLGRVVLAHLHYPTRTSPKGIPLELRLDLIN